MDEERRAEGQRRINITSSKVSSDGITVGNRKIGTMLGFWIATTEGFSDGRSDFFTPGWKDGGSETSSEGNTEGSWIRFWLASTEGSSDGLVEVEGRKVGPSISRRNLMMTPVLFSEANV